MSKLDDYQDLVNERKGCRLCRAYGLLNPAEVDPALDSNEIGPWTRWQGNLNAKLMIVGQDWGDDRYYRTNHGLEADNNPTNTTLQHLLRLTNITIEPPGDFGQQAILFFTNSVLCLKEKGGLQGFVHPNCYSHCSTFLKRQVEIVAPKVLVCLGEKAYRSVMTAYGFSAGQFRKAVESDGRLLPNGTRAIARYHCGKRILNTHRKLKQQEDDWRRLASFL